MVLHTFGMLQMVLPELYLLTHAEALACEAVFYWSLCSALHSVYVSMHHAKACSSLQMTSMHHM